MELDDAGLDSLPAHKLRLSMDDLLSHRQSGVDWQEMLHALESELDFDPTSGRLKVCDLLMLERAKVPTGLSQPIWKLVEQGNDEYQVVLAFLVELANLRSGPQFSRQAKG